MCPLPKRGCFDENGENDEFAFYPPRTMVSLLRRPKTTKITKMAGVTQAKAWFSKSRVCSSLNHLMGSALIPSDRSGNASLRTFVHVRRVSEKISRRGRKRAGRKRAGRGPRRTEGGIPDLGSPLLPDNQPASGQEMQIPTRSLPISGRSCHFTCFSDRIGNSSRFR